MSLTDIILTAARGCIEKSRYVFKRELQNPPDTVNCETLVQFAFRAAGIILPHKCVDQMHYGGEVHWFDLKKSADLVFAAGHWEGYVDTHPKPRTSQRIGHVGIITEHNSVIHASHTAGTVVEESWEDFLRKYPLRAITRIIP